MRDAFSAYIMALYFEPDLFVVLAVIAVVIAVISGFALYSRRPSREGDL